MYIVHQKSLLEPCKCCAPAYGDFFAKIAAAPVNFVFWAKTSGDTAFCPRVSSVISFV